MRGQQMGFYWNGSSHQKDDHEIQEAAQGRGELLEVGFNSSCLLG